MKLLETSKSSNISKLEHDGKNLTITFKTGGQYQYEDVPEELVDDFLKESNASVGKWFYEKVKGKYKYKRLK